MFFQHTLLCCYGVDIDIAIIDADITCCRRCLMLLLVATTQRCDIYADAISLSPMPLLTAAMLAADDAAARHAAYLFIEFYAAPFAAAFRADAASAIFDAAMLRSASAIPSAADAAISDAAAAAMIEIAF